mgnify:CR=1 FL=1
MQKKVFIKTFGCQMNEYDSNRIYDTVKNIGYIRNDDQNDVDCYILNTCHIRDKAKEKVYHEIGRVKKSFKGKNNSDNTLNITLQDVSDDKYLKLYKINTNLVDYNADTLENTIDFTHSDDDMFLGINA